MGLTREKTPSTFDLTSTDYGFDPRPGDCGHIVCWNGVKPRPGDYLILRNEGSTTRYRVTKVDRCEGLLKPDPPTMWMADLEFAPRTTA